MDNTEKSKKKMNVVYSICLTPSKERFEESLKKAVKKSSIILNVEFVILKEHNIIDDKDVFDEKNSFNKLTNLNE